MRMIVTGASGLVGTEFGQLASSQGHEIIPAVRSRQQSGVYWNVAQQTCDAEGFENVDAVVHLAGENIAEGRWTDAKKKRIRESRVQGTKLIASTLASLQQKPTAFVCASAIGYYGNRGDEQMTEDSAPGDGFLAEVCQEWESATKVAADAGIRTVQGRIGVVLSKDGGALKQMLTPFKMGVGGTIGSGNQYMSWIAIQDLARSLLHCVTDASLNGPVNLVAPQPVTNREFTKTLGSVLNRPTIFPVPAFAAKLAFGQMADDLLLSSTRVLPQRLTDAGFQFEFGGIKEALSVQVR
ncbi:MAG: TIGR01777 family oxidoreductase [Pirellulaceae bacterium]